jgi:hypothetical protein
MTENMYGVKFEDGIYIRHENDTGDNMKKTFNQCLYTITGKSFNPFDWTNGNGYDTDDDNNYCICGHVIHNLYFIKYKPTGVQVQVGCECVKKIDENLYKRITSKNFCLACDEPIGKKLKYHKQGFCNDTCKRIYNVSDLCFDFGKYKGLTYNDVLEKHPDYLKFVYDKVDRPYMFIIKRWIEIKLKL